MSTNDPRGSAPYEKSDVNIRGIVLFTVGLALGTALSMWLMAVMFDRFGERGRREAAQVMPRTRVSGAGPEQPPAPVLQGAPGSRFELQDPVLEMEEWREIENEWLDGHGWVDRNAGVVRVPIERAKTLLLERGLPVREEATR